MTTKYEIEKGISLERTAQHLLQEKKIVDAFQHFDEAARHFRKGGEHLKSAMCFASAATCWNIKTGQQKMINAATRSQMGAEEAVKAGYFGYARWLYHEAAMLYEKEGDSDKFSDCFFASQETLRLSLWNNFITGKKNETLGGIEERLNWLQRLKALFNAVCGWLSWLVWGYGELPVRTLLVAVMLILMSSLVFFSSGLLGRGGVTVPFSYMDAVYFSTITFTTVGYGDFAPIGWARIVAAMLGCAGIVLMPLFLIALTRRYMRVYR